MKTLQSLYGFYKHFGESRIGVGAVLTGSIYFLGAHKIGMVVPENSDPNKLNYYQLLNAVVDSMSARPQEDVLAYLAEKILDKHVAYNAESRVFCLSEWKKQAPDEQQ